MYLPGILWLVAATAALRVLPDPPTLPNPVAAARQDSKIHSYIYKATTSAPIHDGLDTDAKDNEEVKKDMLKIASVVFSPPQQLHPFDYSILKKQKSGEKDIHEETVKQKNESSKEEKESVIPKEPLEIEFLTDSITGLQDCEDYGDILIKTSDSTRVKDRKNDETVKNNIVLIPSIVIPTLSEQGLFDYSVIKKQIDDQKSYDAIKQAKQSQNEKKAEILTQKKSAQITVPRNLAIFLDSLTAPQDSEVRTIILSVNSDSDPVAIKSDDEEVRQKMVKIATPPPELTPFDYSILRKHKTDWNLQSEYSAMQAAKNYKEEKPVVSLDLEKPVKVEKPPNPPTLPESVAALPVSKVRMNILNVDTDAAPEVKINDNEEVKINMDKITSTVIPSPPELAPFDYSILRKQMEDRNLKSEYSAKQAAEKYKDKKQTVILNLEKPIKVEVPPPPELTPFDYSTLRKQKTDWNLQSEYSAMQAAKNYKEGKQMVILDLEKPVKVEKPPNPPTLPESVAALPVSKVRMNILNVDTDAAPEVKISDNEEVKMNMNKITSTVIPSPPELAPFDYSILRKQMEDRNLKSEYSAKQAAEKYKDKKQTVILNLEKPIKVEVPPPPELTPFDYSTLRKQKTDWNLQSEYSAMQAAKNYKEGKQMVILDLEKPVKVEKPPNPPTLPESVAALPVSKVRMNVLNVDTDAAPEVKISDNEEVKMNMNKITSTVIPSPPELAPFDYSILRKQMEDRNLKSEYSAKQAAEKYKNKKQTVILNLEKPIKVEVPPPPELTPFDYSTLRKQKTDWNLQSEYSAMQAATNYKEGKQMVILDLEKPVKVEKPPNPPTLPESVAALPVSKVRMNVLNVDTDAAPEVKISDNEEVKMNMNKITSTVIPSPPELAPFDYSILRKQMEDRNLKSEYSARQAAEKYKDKKQTVILNLEKPIKVEVPPPPELTPFDYSTLRKQKTDWNLQSEYSAMQAAKNYKEGKQMVILDLEKPVKVEKPPNPPTLPESVAALPVSKVRMNILNVDTDAAPEVKISDNEEVKMNMNKITSTVIPSPPELAPFDYSILKKQIADRKQKSIYILKQEAAKSKKEEAAFITEKPVEVKVEEPKLIEVSKFVEVSTPMVESMPVEESKPKVELKKKPVKHLEDIPVIIKWTISTAPFLSKLISNCPPRPSFGLNWPLQIASMYRCPRLIYPKFDVDGIIDTN